jgi:ADP-ribose pyrophosphatase
VAETHRTTSSELLFQGKRFTVRHDQITLSNGRAVELEVIDHHDAVVIVALNGEGDVLMVRQYRAPLRRTLLELPAGTIEPGEEPLACAQRELREETGFAADELRPLGDFWTTPGFCTERMFIFLATGLRPDPLPADDDEQIQLERLPIAQALAMARTGQIPDAKTIASLYLAERFITT